MDPTLDRRTCIDMHIDRSHEKPTYLEKRNQRLQIGNKMLRFPNTCRHSFLQSLMHLMNTWLCNFPIAQSRKIHPHSCCTKRVVALLQTMTTSQHLMNRLSSQVFIFVLQHGKALSFGSKDPIGQIHRSTIFIGPSCCCLQELTYLFASSIVFLFNHTDKASIQTLSIL